MNITRNTTKRILAIPVAVPAIPPKPSTAATMAMIKNVIAQLNLVIRLTLLFRGIARYGAAIAPKV